MDVPETWKGQKGSAGMMSGSAMKDGAKSGPSGLLFAESGVVWRVLIAELS